MNVISLIHCDGENTLQLTESHKTPIYNETPLYWVVDDFVEKEFDSSQFFQTIRWMAGTECGQQKDTKEDRLHQCYDASQTPSPPRLY